MKPSYLVPEVQDILRVGSIETIRRYIRNGKGKTFEEIKALDKDNKAEGYYSLFLEKENAKPYRITAESLVLLIMRRLKLKNIKEAEAILNHHDDITAITASAGNNTLKSSQNAGPVLSGGITGNMFPSPLRSSTTAIKDIFKTERDKELYIKGLYLLQIIDGEIAKEEEEMIANRVSMLGITKADIDKWVPDPSAIDKALLTPQIKFINRRQSVIFILEALRLAWQDGIYSTEEQELILKLAQNNNISRDSLATFEQIISNEYDAAIIREWQEYFNK